MLKTVEKLRFSDNLCFDFAKHGRPKVPMRKLSPSISIKTVIHAPGFYDFALQNLFHARSRAKRNTIEKLALSTDRGLAVSGGVFSCSGKKKSAMRAKFHNLFINAT